MNAFTPTLTLPYSAYAGATIAQHNVAPRYRSYPPGPGVFVALTKTIPGKIIGTNTAKVAGGFLIGVGLALSWSGLGIGLVAAGAVPWLVSTASSSAALNDTSTFTLARHLAWSLFLGAGVALGGLLTFGTNTGFAAGISLQRATLALGIILLGPLTDVWEIFSERTEQHPDPVPVVEDPFFSAEFSGGPGNINLRLLEIQATTDCPEMFMGSAAIRLVVWRYRTNRRYEVDCLQKYSTGPDLPKHLVTLFKTGQL